MKYPSCYLLIHLPLDILQLVGVKQKSRAPGLRGTSFIKDDIDFDDKNEPQNKKLIVITK